MFGLCRLCAPSLVAGEKHTGQSLLSHCFPLLASRRQPRVQHPLGAFELPFALTLPCHLLTLPCILFFIFFFFLFLFSPSPLLFFLSWPENYLGMRPCTVWSPGQNGQNGGSEDDAQFKPCVVQAGKPNFCTMPGVVAQAQWDEGLTAEIANHPAVLGGFVFEWADEFWKSTCVFILENAGLA